MGIALYMPSDRQRTASAEVLIAIPVPSRSPSTRPGPPPRRDPRRSNPRPASPTPTSGLERPLQRTVTRPACFLDLSSRPPPSSGHMAVGAAGPCLLAVALAATWISTAAEQAGTRHKSVKCMPCFRTYIGDTYLDTLTGQVAPRHELAEIMTDSSESCKDLAGDVEVPKLSKLHQQLVGEGSHRRLVYSVEFGACEDATVDSLDGYDAHLVIIEKLPNGVFADPFELQHFVERKVFLDVTVFGDTNLELPTALSNQSAVEIHYDLRPSTSTNCNLVIELPLHARYPPLDASGYATVEFGRPDLFLRYRKKEINSSFCLWILKNFEDAPVEKAAWRIPCGDERHIGFVSSITFLSALVCSVSIVLAAVMF